MYAEFMFVQVRVTFHCGVKRLPYGKVELGLLVYCTVSPILVTCTPPTTAPPGKVLYMQWTGESYVPSHGTLLFLA